MTSDFWSEENSVVLRHPVFRSFLRTALETTTGEHFPALAAPAVPSPADTPFSGMRTYLGCVGPRQGQALTSTYPRSTPTAESCLCKQSALQDRHPRARSKLSPKKAGLRWPQRFVWLEAADRSQPGNCPHSGHSCAQTPAATFVSSVEKART